jgi:hypothetical protein
MDSKTAFDRICGDCAGIDMGSITVEDITKQAEYFFETGEIKTEDELNSMIELACHYLNI